MKKITYGKAIFEAADFLLQNHDDLFFIGQGLWSPWYVGDTMTDLEKKYGKDRVIDTAVSESAVTGMSFGAAVAGKKSIVVHPRMDFMLYASDTIVNQAAKWHYMFGAKAPLHFTVRCIINRGGAQGAQHSQALHSMFAHVPGLRVVMPYSVKDARDLLISSALSPDPVIFIEDRWLYDETAEISDIENMKPLFEEGPSIVLPGSDLTVVATGYNVKIAIEAAKILGKFDIFPEVVDIRIISPLDIDVLANSLKETGKMLVLDGGWGSCGFSADIIARLAEGSGNNCYRFERMTLPAYPAPSNLQLESDYYISADDVVETIKSIMVGS